ncbi:MAG: family 20 glycosylhydrolase, partial [Bacteroidales bacterium]|nr:family 20 glycosylhydrolase [Bacteroidales bacterium]
MISSLLLMQPLHAGVSHLLPKPQHIVESSGASFRLGRKLCLDDPTGCAVLADFLLSRGCKVVSCAPGGSFSGKATVTVELVNRISGAYDYRLAGYPDEAYKLKITGDRIEIKAVTPVGVIRAAQTLVQLAEDEKNLAPVEITDWPAFKLRGYLHDVGRSFISVEELLREIDLLSRFKVNTFHFHMTENQAWRFEVKSHPELTESMTRLPGLYYTQEQCSLIEEYAAARGMIVIPEIDMPGHSAAFERATGCDMQSPEGMAILDNVLEEVAKVFPRAPYIHIGADEKRIYNDSFLPSVTDKVHSLGKLVVCYNPIYGLNI